MSSEIEKWRPGDPVSIHGPISDEQRAQVEDELIKSMMLAAASYAPPTGQIRFRVLDHGELRKEVTIPTQDALEINRRRRRRNLRDTVRDNLTDKELPDGS